MESINADDFEKFFEPGIFSVQCKANGKIFYQKSNNFPFGIGFFMDNLEKYECPNPALLEDLKNTVQQNLLFTW